MVQVYFLGILIKNFDTFLNIVALTENIFAIFLTVQKEKDIFLTVQKEKEQFSSSV